jgi:hypothetical protein
MREEMEWEDKTGFSPDGGLEARWVSGHERGYFYAIIDLLSQNDYRATVEIKTEPYSWDLNELKRDKFKLPYYSPNSRFDEDDGEFDDISDEDEKTETFVEKFDDLDRAKRWCAKMDKYGDEIRKYNLGKMKEQIRRRREDSYHDYPHVPSTSDY